MSGAFRIAAAQYPIEFIGDWATYEAKIARWVEDAAHNRARLLVFPEYFSMELASLFAPEIHGSLPDQLAALQDLLPNFLELFATQAPKLAARLLRREAAITQLASQRALPIRSSCFRPLSMKARRSSAINSLSLPTAAAKEAFRAPGSYAMGIN